MGTNIKTVLLLFTTMALGEGREDFKGNVKEIILEMNERIALTEEMTIKNKEEFLELKTKNNQLEESINDLTSTKKELITANEGLLSTIQELKAKDQDLEKEVFILKEAPFFHECGVGSSVSIISETIPYIRGV